MAATATVAEVLPISAHAKYVLLTVLWPIVFSYQSILDFYRKWYQFGKSALERLAEAEAGLFATAGAKLISRFIPVGFYNF